MDTRGGISCSTVVPGDVFGVPQVSNSTGRIGIVTDPKEGNSLVAVSHKAKSQSARASLASEIPGVWGELPATTVLESPRKNSQQNSKPTNEKVGQLEIRSLLCNTSSQRWSLTYAAYESPRRQSGTRQLAQHLCLHSEGNT
jgi:hypothetical protein